MSINPNKIAGGDAIPVPEDANLTAVTNLLVEAAKENPNATIKTDEHGNIVGEAKIHVIGQPVTKRVDIFFEGINVKINVTPAQAVQFGAHLHKEAAIARGGGISKKKRR